VSTVQTAGVLRVNCPAISEMVPEAVVVIVIVLAPVVVTAPNHNSASPGLMESYWARRDHDATPPPDTALRLTVALVHVTPNTSTSPMVVGDTASVLSAVPEAV
jgi:hypothetical protein